MVATNSMATRSSLELMLDKLQQVEDRPKDTPPALPARPVSRARLPRVRRPLQLDFHRGSDAEKEGSTESFRRADNGQSNGIASEFDHFQKKIKLSEHSKEVEEKGASKIQKCYRGHRVRCCYEELRGGAIALQSFIRGEIARRGYRNRSSSHKAITLIQKQIRKYFERRERQEHQSPFTQSKSDSLDQRHSDEAKHNPNSDQTQVPCTALIELQKRVLRSEARVREKNEENLALKRQLEEMEKKWQQYEERMKSMEKEWQDQFTYIQVRLPQLISNPINTVEIALNQSILQETLAAGKTNRNQNRDNFTATAGIPTSDIQINSVYQRESTRGEDEVAHEQACLKIHPPAELRRLKRRFETWKKEYRNKLRDAQATLKKGGNSESAKRNWWGRLSS